MQERIFSRMEIYDTADDSRTVLFEVEGIIGSPNWTPDGNHIVYDAFGKMYSFCIDSGLTTQLNLGPCDSCNCDHMVFADGKTLAFSSGYDGNPESHIWLVPLEGGMPRRVTDYPLSYLHGCSPDGKLLAYCACRDNKYSVYVISADGGEERRLTFDIGLEDGPEFTPDGKELWYNTARSGSMQLWKMNIDGTNPQQMTFDTDVHSWFPHISPDGSKIVYVTYDVNEVEATEHPRNKHIQIRLIDSEGKTSPTVLMKMMGSAACINVNSWAPDSRRFAFVSYFNKN